MNKGQTTYVLLANLFIQLQNAVNNIQFIISGLTSQISWTRVSNQWMNSSNPNFARDSQAQQPHSMNNVPCILV